MTSAIAEMIDETAVLPLTAREREEVRLLLESSLADLHEEIIHTDRYEFREGLKERRAVLAGVLRRLRALPVTTREGQREA